MASLFGKNKLREIASKLQTSELESKITLIKAWHNDYHNGSLKADKETSREQAYNQDFFIKILEYKEKPAVPFSLEPKATTDKGQLPDAVLSHTDTSKDIKNVAAVVELKGAAIELDRPQRREGNMSPVQQGFKYKTQYRNCPFVVVSNFWEFRLYHDNQLDYELWTLDDLVDPEDDYLKFKTFYTLLHSDNLTTPKGASKTEGWLSDIRSEQEEIGKKFYKVYRQARLDLLRDIYQHNDSIRSDIDMGIEKAQKIIDRIVFACFAEDRGLLPDDTLRRVIKAADNSTFGGSLWSTFKAFFEAIDVGSDKLEIPDGYNGGLFAHDPTLNALKVSDEPLRKIASISDYNFVEDLSVTILGHIFEQSISDLEEIKSKVEESENLESLQQSRRKKDGIFYTPDYIVRYIVDNSLGAYLRQEEERLKQEFKLKGDITDKSYEKREKRAYLKYYEFLSNVKVVDPACGSGAFLVYVFDYLLAEHQRVGSILGLNKGVADFSQTYKNILTRNIYGVDLNDESVEITKLSLWLKTAQKGKKLTALNDNIKCGNSLIDDPEVAGNKAFNWQEQFPEIFANGGFDVVVGNPPYIFLRSNNMSKPEGLYYRDRYNLYKLKPRTDIYFFEKAFEILKTGGYLSFISPNNVLTIRSLADFRKYFLENTSEINIVNIYGKVFSDANVDTMISTFRKDQTGKNLTAYNMNDGELTEILKIDKNVFVDGDNIINFEMYQSPEKVNLVKKIESGRQKLKDVVAISNGLVAYKLGNGTPEQDKEMGQKRVYHSHAPNGSDWKPYFGGSDVKRYYADWSGEYIKYGNNLGEPRRLELFDKTHLLVRVIPSQSPHSIQAMVVPENYFNDQNYIVVYGRNDDEVSLLPALCGILNSKLISFWFVNKLGKMQRGLFPQMKAGELANFPIVEPSDDIKELSTATLDKIVILQNKSNSFRKLISSEYGIEKWPAKLNKWWTLDFSDFTKSLKVNLTLAQKDELLQLFEKYKNECAELDAQIQRTEKEIDHLVYKLYNLTPEEITIIEGSV